MNNKNRAAKAVNMALGLIVLVMVILCSPLFGYARGFAPEDQRGAAPVSADTTRTSPSWPTVVEATPRPTAPPTPTPVVLPTAPPTPVPTPTPQRTPQATPQPVVQQPVYNNWQQEQYQPEPEYEEPGYEDWQQEEQPPAEEQQQSDTGGQIIDNGSGGVIQSANADLVINLPNSGGGQSTAISVVTSEAGETGGGETGGGETGGGEVDWQPSQDSNEAEPLAF